MLRMKGLGRGLDALLADNSKDDKERESFQNLKITLLQPGKYQPRTNMDQESLVSLAESIRTQGVMQPIMVRQVSGGRYEIIAGERRWRASQIAGLLEIPALVREVADERALAIKEFGMTHETAGLAVGSSRSTVSNLLRLLSLPLVVQELIMQEKIDMGHGRALLGLSTTKRQIETANVVAHKQLSVRETEKLVYQIEQLVKKQSPKSDRDLLCLQESVSEKLGAQVIIKPGKKDSGKMIIHYNSLDQLDGILSRL